MTDLIRVLHIDDLVTDRELVKDALENEEGGFKVTQAISGDEFAELLSEGDFDIVLSDFNILGFEGTDVIRMVREKKPNLPVIILTGTGSETVAVDSMKEGAADYVIKTPGHIRRLPHAIRRVMEKSRLEKKARDALEALKTNEKRYKAIVENAGEVILVVQHGEIRFVNAKAADVYGFAPEDLIGRSFIEFIFPEDRKSALERYEARMRGEELPDRNTFRILDKEGGIKWMEVNSVRIEWEGKNATLNFLVDITKRKQAEEDREKLQKQLSQAQRLESIGRLAGGIAHDFNNMLSVIIGYGENILYQLPRGNPLRDEVKEILVAGKRSADLTRQLLAFSRKQVSRPETLNLNTIVRNIQKMLKRLIGEDIELVLSLAEDLYSVRADPGQMEQVIVNLAVNARDAMPRGGRLIIETKNVELDEAYAKNHIGAKPGHYVLMAVSDNGTGMDSTVLSRIFEPFFTTKGVGEGTGLGLATVYGIVKQSEGNIWAYSEPGMGASFKIYLPRIEGNETRPFIEKPNRKQLKKWNGEHILVVEDEESVRTLLEAQLKKLGFSVSIASNGAEALSLIDTSGMKPMLVITDVVMPKMSGIELIRQLKEKLPETALLFISGYTDMAIARHGGIDDTIPFIQKPFTIGELEKKLREIFG